MALSEGVTPLENRITTKGGMKEGGMEGRREGKERRGGKWRTEVEEQSR